MTLLIFKLWDDSAEIFMDSLSTQSDGITPNPYQPKVWTLPHLKMSVAVTGSPEVALEWCRLVASLEDVRDIADVDQVAPETLRTVQAQLVEQYGDVGTTTVFAFGFREGGKISAFKYSSMDRGTFESEPICPGVVVVKPRPLRFEWAPPESWEEVAQLAERVKAEQDDLRAAGESSVAIGGELWATIMEDGEVRTGRIYRFADFDEKLQPEWKFN